MFNKKLAAAAGWIFLATATSLTAQETVKVNPSPGRVEVGLSYTYMRANAGPGECGCFNMSGGTAEAAIRVWRGFSAVADITGTHTGSTSTPDQPLSLLFFSGGPRFTYRQQRSSRYSLFGQGLFGTVHGFDAPFPTTASPESTSANALAVFVGGGFDISIGHHLAIRAIEADYGLTHLPNAVNDSQHLLRLSTGLVLRRW